MTRKRKDVKPAPEPAPAATQADLLINRKQLQNKSTCFDVALEKPASRRIGRSMCCKASQFGARIVKHRSTVGMEKWNSQGFPEAYSHTVEDLSSIGVGPVAKWNTCQKMGKRPECMVKPGDRIICAGAVSDDDFDATISDLVRPGSRVAKLHIKLERDCKDVFEWQSSICPGTPCATPVTPCSLGFSDQDETSSCELSHEPSISSTREPSRSTGDDNSGINSGCNSIVQEGHQTRMQLGASSLACGASSSAYGNRRSSLISRMTRAILKR